MRRISLAAAVMVVAGAVSTLPAHADGDAVVHVDPAAAVCSDTDPARGSAEVPYCTLQTAVDAAVPGQTLELAAGVYPPVRITRSGTAGSPITLLGAPSSPPRRPAPSVRQWAAPSRPWISTAPPT
ncbi:hypothetical protein ACFQZC_21220 [Streptacidiphilus monticola]